MAEKKKKLSRAYEQALYRKELKHKKLMEDLKNRELAWKKWESEWEEYYSKITVEKENGEIQPVAEEATEEAEPITSEPVKTVDRAELRAKVIELSAKGFKEQTKEIVRAYAQTVTSVPEDKVAECYEKLVALEAKGC